MKKLYLAVMACFAVTLAHSQAGNYVEGYTYPAEEILNAALDANGNTIISGRTANGNGFARRLLPNGTVDTSFPTINLQLPYELVLVQHDGKIILGKTSTGAGGTAILRRYSASGALEQIISQNFPAGLTLTSIAQQAVSHGLLLGTVRETSQGVLYRVLRITAAGQIDTAYSNLIPAFNGSIVSIRPLPQSDDFYVGGGFTTVGGSSRRNIAKINGSGSLNSWQYNSTLFFNVFSVTTDSQSNVIFTGRAQGTGTVPSIYKVSSAGSLIWSKAVSQTGYAYNTGVAVQSNDQVIVVGGFDHIEGYNSYSRIGIARLNADGTLDTCFDPGTGVINALTYPADGITTILIDSSQNIYLANGIGLSNGAFTSYNGLAVPSFAKVNGTGTGFTPALANDSGTTTAAGGVVLNVLGNDTVNGQPATVPACTLSVVSAPTGITLATTGAAAGQVSVAPNTPAGTYTLTYKLCYGTSNCYCSTATATITVTPGIVANDDSYATLSQGGGTYNILGNDLNGTAAASTSNVNITLLEPSFGGSINLSGKLVMPAGLPSGTYTVTYQICDKINTSLCDTAVVTITIDAPGVDAFDDSGSVVAGANTVAIANVLANDKNPFVKSGNATLSNVSITQISSSHVDIYVEPETGAVLVGANVPPGTYTLVYQICNFMSPPSCDTATVTITVAAPPAPDAVNDTITVEIGDDGFLNILANDTFAGQPATASNVTISVVGTYPADGPFFNTTTGDLHVPSTLGYGTYTFTYQICAGASTSCDTATVTVNIVSPVLVPGTRANNRVRDIALLSNGNIAIVGRFTSYNYTARNNVALLTPSLVLAPFTSTGPTGNVFLTDVEVTFDDKLLVAGRFTGFNGIETPNGLVRISASGAMDSTFNQNGIGIQNDEYINEVALRPNGGIVAVGSFKKYNGQTANNIIGLNSDGSPDTTFVTGVGLTESATAITRQGNKFLIGHLTTAFYNGTVTESIFRVTETGSIDTSFQQKSFGYTTWEYPHWGVTGIIEDIKVQADDYIIVAGEFLSYDGVSRNRIVRLLPNGGLDHTFDPGTGFNGTVRTVTLDSEGNIYCGGSFTTYNNQPVKTIVKLSQNGMLVTSFNVGTGPEMGSQAGGVDRLLTQGDGKILLGGHFVTYNSIYAGFITRIHPSTPGTQSRMGAVWEAEPAVATKAVKASIYPNPSNGIFIIDMPMAEEQPYDITIHNALGQEVFRGTVNSQASQIDLSTMDAGNYFVRIQNNNETINKIITKK